MTGTPTAIFDPLDWQIAPWNDKSPTMLLTGAAGGGKSRIAAEKLHAYMLKYPGATGIVGRKDRASANKSVVPFLRYTVQQDTDWGTFKKGDQLFEYNNGSQLWVVGLKDERQREGLRSIGKDGSVDIAWFEEANKLSEDDHNEISARMRGTAAGWRQIIYTTNPDGPNHWIKKRLIDGGQASTHYSRPEDNPYNPPEYIDRLKGLTGVSKERLWFGKWVQAEGAIYPEYEVSKHLIDFSDLPGLVDGRLPRTGRYMVSIDFGYTNPLSCSLWYIHDNDAFHVRQIYYTKRTIEEHAPKIRRMVTGLSADEIQEFEDNYEGNRLERILANTSLPIEAWITDHDAEDRATLERHLNITTKPAYKAVMPGIENVKSRLSNNELFFVRGALMELDNKLEREKKPTCTIDEISGYRWSDKKQDTPVKEQDHGMDEMRYLLAHLDNIGKETISISPKATVTSYIGGHKKQSDRPGF